MVARWSIALFDYGLSDQIIITDSSSVIISITLITFYFDCSLNNYKAFWKRSFLLGVTLVLKWQKNDDIS